MPEITMKFEPRDLWIGVYWVRARSIESRYVNWDFYVCILPMLPIRLRFERGWR